MSKHRRISTEEKIRIARNCIDGKISQREAEAQAGVSRTVVSDWIRLYLNEGASGFLPGRRNRQYDPALKEAAVKDYLSGRGSLREICRIYKIRNQIQLRTWIKVYSAPA